MIRNGVIPQQAGFNQLNPRILALEDAGIIIPTANREWQSSITQPRRAMLNNFGAAGSNVALLLEERMVSETTKTRGLDRSSYIFNLSAQTVAAHQEYINQFRNYLRETKRKPSIQDLTYTVTARRETFAHRISIVCNSIEDLETKLCNVDVSNSEPVLTSKAVVFGFSGQGSIYRGMSEGLLESSLFFRKEIYKCDKIIQDLGFPSFLSYLTKDDEIQGCPTISGEVITSQCACVAVGYSLAKLLISWNVVPKYVFGHR